LTAAVLHILKHYIQKAVAVFQEGNTAIFLSTGNRINKGVSAIYHKIPSYLFANALLFCQKPIFFVRRSNARAPPFAVCFPPKKQIGERL